MMVVLLPDSLPRDEGTEELSGHPIRSQIYFILANLIHLKRHRTNKFINTKNKALPKRNIPQQYSKH